MQKIAIIGAGIAGLTAACLLKRQGFEVVVFEQNNHIGGVMQSHREDGYLIEKGPNTILENSPEVSDFFETLQLRERKVAPDNCAKIRYIACRGRLIPLPMSPPLFLKSELFPLRAKLRLLCEPLIPPRKSSREESIAQFVKRRLGTEILNYAINPFVAGTYAGVPEKLSIKHAFPKLYALEKEHNSIIRGQIHMKKSGKKPPHIISFRDGLGEFPQAMAKEISPQNIHLNTKIESIDFRDDSIVIKSQKQQYKVSKVIYAGTVHGLCHLQINGSQINKPQLDKVYYPPVSVMCLGFKRQQVKHSLNGFGFLIPAREKARILGALFSSSLFKDRAPKDHVLLTVFVGGARQPEYGLLPQQQMIDYAMTDLRKYLHINGDPGFVHLTQWEKSIPQYELGYGECKKTFGEIEKDYPGLHLIGNYREGVSITDTIRFAQKTVRGIAKVTT
ncbi:protoporphyrinogen oxidase [Candidatus Uabimicrobium amorphum]|uniref:Coproporphyrinogen III oxidase n=1 Tax=Uabimicrobium amorphum TaxID=2596890 RepID=A0A5S9IJ78_UABAM|nr:protoporphyrinogen oxidase [Candidatus Uabimicrobium amorphum]BBM82843.1 protoporphyrinogen oxidase [Candidatus Uabimicrobium amorphum]